MSESAKSPESEKGQRKRSLSMHDGIAVWCDCCSCEAEPYWVEAAEALGMGHGSDYEEDDGSAV
jgi:hypothetical protein